jgi:dUTP pyrophosphatase
MIKFMRMNKNAVIPKLAKEGDAGFDLSSMTECVLQSGARVVIKTGISVEIPPSARGEIWPRSGLAVNHGIGILGGMIDSGYRGELMACLINHGHEPLVINIGDRIAQIVFSPTITDADEWHGTVSETERGADGFGSTGS